MKKNKNPRLKKSVNNKVEKQEVVLTYAKGELSAISNTERKMHPKNKIKNIILWIINAILLLLIIFVIIITLKAKVSNSVIPNFLGYSSVIIDSKNMEPALKPGDLIITNQNSLKNGDIIAFYENNSVFISRLVNTTENASGKTLYTIRNDSGNTKATSISSDMLIGKSVLKLSRVGNIVKFLNSPAGINWSILFVILIGSIMFLTTKYLKYKKSSYVLRN